MKAAARAVALVALIGGLLILFWVRGASTPAISAMAGPRSAAVHIYPRDQEIVLALSAGPESVRHDAGVYVLTPGGFVTVRASRNGFTCIVNRDGPGNEKPTCYDAVGTKRILPVDLAVGALLLKGVPQSKIEAQILAGFRSGTFHVADHPGVAYMLSDHNCDRDPSTGKTIVFPPHVMFYAPYLTNKDIGSKGDFAYGLPSIGYRGPMGFIIVPCGPYCGKPLDLSM
jgi:hypothetical protein